MPRFESCPKIALKRSLYSLFFVGLLTLPGCASLVSSISAGMANNLTDAILNSSDIGTVREGVPAYLLLIDSFLRESPDDVNLLLAASRLNGSYSLFAESDRAKLLTRKSLDYAMQAACITDSALCNLGSVPYDDFERQTDELAANQIEVGYVLGVAWAGWIQANSDDWNAIGQLGRVKFLMEKIIALDETFEDGGPHLYMGGLETLLPAALGGNPEKGKAHFERSLALSEGDNLMIRVVYAQQYARLVFDKQLHDRLLREVLEANPVVEGLTLINRIAQERAADLLAESDDYF